jgi:hypothetical protein
MPKRQKQIDLTSQAAEFINLTISPGDTFTFTLQNIQQFYGSLGIIFIGDTQQRLGLFPSGYYLFKIPAAGSKLDLVISAGQTMAMSGQIPIAYSGEIQLITPLSQIDSFNFSANITPADKIQVITASSVAQHTYRFLGVLSAAPTTSLAQYQIYFNSTLTKFFVYDGEGWVEIV